MERVPARVTDGQGKEGSSQVKRKPRTERTGAAARRKGHL